MKTTHIKIPHKCGSTIINTIFKHGADLCSNTFKDLDSVSKSHYHESSEHEMIFTRHITDIDQLYKWDSVNKNKHLFVVRHPLTRLISKYYSFGWTHTENPRWIQDKKERKKISAEIINSKKNIQQISLDDYIINGLGSRVDRFMSKCIQKPITTCTCILPYEMLVTDPDRFITTSLDFLSMADVAENVIDNFRDQLTPIEDRTDKIINNECKSHRRTSDIHEWKTKLDIHYINNKTKNIHVKMFDQYADFLSSYNIK